MALKSTVLSAVLKPIPRALLFSYGFRAAFKLESDVRGCVRARLAGEKM
uniref:Uncharacterized protein n=1 Tax=Anguilla anguilla TaxID=7936 RepID=A0A0E9VC02_ANGAN